MTHREIAARKAISNSHGTYEERVKDGIEFADTFERIYTETKAPKEECEMCKGSGNLRNYHGDYVDCPSCTSKAPVNESFEEWWKRVGMALSWNPRGVAELAWNAAKDQGK